MAEVCLLMELVRRQWIYAGALNGKRSFDLLKWPLLGCMVSLAVGCSTLPSQQVGGASQTSLTRHPAKTPVASQPRETAKPSKWELIIPDQPAIETCVQRFSIEKRKSFQTQLDRARYYVAPVQDIFGQAGLPKDLVYVALVESGFSPTARSHASAVGMWQFISSTGKRYGLEQNKWVDERRHPFKSARAAAEYLSFLYDTFGSWELALAAYNAGENGVQAALDQSGLKTFWELAENGYLPSETRDYVPKVLAAVKIIRDPAHYGFHFDQQYYTPKHETVSVPGGMKLAWLEKKTGIPEPTIRNHNPELIQSVTPPTCSEYELCVPVGAGETVLTALAEPASPVERRAGKGAAELSETSKAAAASKKPESKSAVKLPADREAGVVEAKGAAAASHTVRAGDTLTGLARKYGLPAKDLAALNGIKANQPIKAGQTLRVSSKEPGTGSTSKEEIAQQKTAPTSSGKIPAKDSSAMAAPKVEMARNSATQTSKGKEGARVAEKPSRKLRYPVRQGDTLSSIAKQFQISVESICASNDLKRSQKLTPGSILVICTNEQELASVGKRRKD